jgi:hypothetical protein
MRALMVILSAAVMSVSVLATTHTISDGYFNSITIKNNDTLIMTGGGGGTIWGRDNSIIDIRNTTSPYASGITGLDTIKLWENSQLRFSGGSVRLLEATHNAFIVLTGGQIDSINAYYPAPGDINHITVYCQPGWTYQNTYLTGLWLDGSAFNIRIYSQGASSVLDNITIIPEPTTMMLFAVGGICLYGKRRTRCR